MAEMSYEFERLSSRGGFNRSLRHFKLVMKLVSEFEGRKNLADLLVEMLERNGLEPRQVCPILNALLVDKYGYRCRSLNLGAGVDEPRSIAEETAKWNAVDMVVAYYHPELGVVPINPKNVAHWDAVQSFKRNELAVLYAGAFSETPTVNLCETALAKLGDLLQGRTVRTPASLTKGRFKPEVAKKAREEKPEEESGRKEPTAERAAATPSAAAAEGPARTKLTPMFSIPVTNELFHNGNVEAWKRIILSYNTKHPELSVYIFYEGERIHDINTLFKWGKVKHGSAIVIAVAGPDIQDVSKLRRYLKQGASPMFEAFLRFPVNQILPLF